MCFNSLTANNNTQHLTSSTPNRRTAPTPGDLAMSDWEAYEGEEHESRDECDSDGVYYGANGCVSSNCTESDDTPSCMDSARCTDRECEYRRHHLYDPHNNWTILKRKHGHKAIDLWNAIVSCRGRILWLQDYESKATVDTIGRVVIVLTAIQTLVRLFPDKLSDFTLGYTMAYIIKYILPELPSGLPKKPLRAMHKLVRDTLDLVRTALVQQKQHQFHTAQRTRPSGPASLLKDDPEVSLTGRSFLTNPKLCPRGGTEQREMVCVSKGMKKMTLHSVNDNSGSDNGDDDKENVEKTAEDEEMAGPFGPFKLMVPKAWGCNKPLNYIDDDEF